MAQWTVEQIDPDNLSPADSQRLTQLDDMVWPAALRTRDPEQYASAPPPHHDWPHRQRPRLLVVRDDHGQIIAKAGLRPRQVQTPRGMLTVLALAGVCSHPDYRGQGLGKAVVQAALALVDSGDFDCAFFQTGVPGFYEKLNCRIIRNRIVNSLAKHPRQCPFWDKCAMIYPASFDWPEGDIDTLGPGW